MSLVLGLDASYGGFGLAAMDPITGHADLVTLKFKPEKFGEGIERLMAIEGALAAHFKAWQEAGEITHVCLEGYASNAKFRREQAGELGAIVKRTLLGMFGEPVGFPTLVAPTLLKKFVCGRGDAPKDSIKKDVLRKWGRDIDDNNAADAYGLARLAKALLCGTELAYEQQVLDKLTMHTERFV